MESEKAMVIGIVLGICLFLFLTCGLWLPNVKWLFPEKQEEKDNIVLYINQDENTNSRNIDIIDMPDCEMGWVDYNSEKKTVLYINNQNNITEKNLETGYISNLMNVEQLNEKLGGTDLTFEDVSYGPNHNEISFICDNDVYVYNFTDNILTKKTNCTTRLYYYKWKNNNELYTLNDNDVRGGLEVYYRKEGNKEILIIENVVMFTLSENGETLYGLHETWSHNGFGIEPHRELIEMNLESGAIRTLVEVNTNGNYILKCIEDRYLVYVENKSKTKVFRYDLISGKKKRIYKTKNSIVGIIRGQGNLL